MVQWSIVVQSDLTAILSACVDTGQLLIHVQLQQQQQQQQLYMYMYTARNRVQLFALNNPACYFS